MSSEPTHDFLMANLKREEAEKQEQAAMRLAKQEQKTFMRKRSWKSKGADGTSRIGGRTPQACCRS